MFAVYTHKELSLLKTQIREHEKLIQTLQLSNNAQDVQVRGFFSGLHVAMICEREFGIATDLRIVF